MTNSYFTTKKLIMFILMCIQFANMAFSFAISPSLATFTFLDWSVLLMLVMLYVDPELQRRYTVPWCVAFYIVSFLTPLFASALTFRIDFIFYAALVAGAFFFGVNVFQNNFSNLVNNLIITIGCGLYIGLQLYYLLPVLFMGMSNLINLLLFVFYILGTIVVPLSMIIYTWLKRFRIE